MAAGEQDVAVAAGGVLIAFWVGWNLPSRAATILAGYMGQVSDLSATGWKPPPHHAHLQVGQALSPAGLRGGRAVTNPASGRRARTADRQWIETAPRQPSRGPCTRPAA